MFLGYIHSFRAFAIIFIVASHCYGLLDWQASPWQLGIVKTAVENSTVFFVFISGFLFQYLSDRFELKRYLKRKLLNVISPYVFVSIPMIALHYATRRGSFDPESGLEFPSLLHNIAWLYATGYHILPFYFIPMLAVYYAAAPLLIRADRDGKIYWLLPLLLVLSTLVHRPVDFTQILHSAAFFFPAYLFGMWFCRKREVVLPLVDRYLLWLVGAAALLIFVEVAALKRFGTVRSRSMFSMENGVADVNFLHKIVLCCVLVGLFRKYDGAWTRRLSSLAALSFGIYFVHYYFVKLFAQVVFQDSLPAGNLALFAVAVAVITALSVALLWLAKKILGRYSRPIVGC